MTRLSSPVDAVGAFVNRLERFKQIIKQFALRVVTCVTHSRRFPIGNLLIGCHQFQLCRALIPLAAKMASRDRGAGRYQRHRPEQTLLYRIVEQYYPAFTSNLAEQGRELPSYCLLYTSDAADDTSEV